MKMKSFEELLLEFNTHFDTIHFPGKPETLYQPNNYFLKLGGKRVRPVMCLMGNELFGELQPDACGWPTPSNCFTISA